MNQDLLKNNYILLRNFIPVDEAKELARRYKDLQKQIGFGDDIYTLLTHLLGVIVKIN